jgi:hypothetical protein
MRNGSGGGTVFFCVPFVLLRLDSPAGARVRVCLIWRLPGLLFVIHPAAGGLYAARSGHPRFASLHTAIAAGLAMKKIGRNSTCGGKTKKVPEISFRHFG